LPAHVDFLPCRRVRDAPPAWRGDLAIEGSKHVHVKSRNGWITEAERGRQAT
jgi:hypothetical protein